MCFILWGYVFEYKMAHAIRHQQDVSDAVIGALTNLMQKGSEWTIYITKNRKNHAFSMKENTPKNDVARL